MRKKIISIVFAVCILCALSSCGNSNFQTSVGEAKNSASAKETILGYPAQTGEKYTIYLGLNDKDTYEQILSTEDALEKANQICAKHTGGYTQFSAKGGWTNDDGTLGHEKTIVYEIYDISEDDLIKEFNQSAVLVEKSENPHIYYSGE